MKKINILFLDIEGGHGGSSLSLFKTIQYLDRTQVKPIVICKKKGIFNAYKDLGINCTVENRMPTFSSLRKDNRNLLFFFYFIFFLWPTSYFFRKRLNRLIASESIDLIHCNLISLFVLAKWLKKKNPSIPITLHVRTNPVLNFTSKIQAKLSSSVFDDYIYITENEKKNMISLLGKKLPGKIIFNSAEITNSNIYIENTKTKLPLEILTLSNYSYPRGIDRVIDIASHIPDHLRNKFRFTIAGDYKFPRFMPYHLKILGFKGSTLKDYAKLKGVEDLFVFKGHVRNVAGIIDNSDVLIKPTRENNPWGRDIIEALSKGKAVISVGAYDKFVKTNYTGLLQKKYNAYEIVDWLLKHANNLKLFEKYKKNAIKIVHEICNPSKNAKKSLIFWKNIVKNK